MSSTPLLRQVSLYIVTVIVVVAAWWACVYFTGAKEYLLPSPQRVLSNMWIERNLLLLEGLVTAMETMLGFMVSVALAVPIAVLMTEWRIAYSLGYPLVISLQTVPKIAVAPLLVVALGFGMAPKVIVVVLVAFFPIVVNSIAGFRSVDADLHNLGRILGLSRTRFFLHVSLPQALPFIFAGLKVAITLALIGAVVAEFVGSDEGLGHLLMSASARLDSILSFSAVMGLTILGLLLYGVLAVCEWIIVPWRRASNLQSASQS